MSGNNRRGQAAKNADTQQADNAVADEVVQELDGVATAAEKAEVAASVAGSYEAEVAALEAAGNTVLVQLLRVCESYIEAMHPHRPSTAATHAVEVSKLYAAMSNIIRMEKESDAKLGWFLFLMLINRDTTGVFDPRYLMRGVTDWPAGANDTATYGMLLALATATADPETRAAAVKETNIGAFPIAAIKDRLMVIYA